MGFGRRSHGRYLYGLGEKKLSEIRLLFYETTRPRRSSLIALRVYKEKRRINEKKEDRSSSAWPPGLGRSFVRSFYEVQLSFIRPTRIEERLR